jgi:uncharacterized protein
MIQFTPGTALLGGALIGAAAALLLWFNGEIAGVSGVLRGLLPPRRGAILWRLLFIIGLVGGAALYYRLLGNAPLARPDFPHSLLVAAGLLVGFGTGLARGCTSGHGVCGLARLSPRSLAATACFLIVAVIATYVVRHVIGIF